MVLLGIFITLVFLYSLVSARLERTCVTAPIVFTVAGMLVLLLLPELRDRKVSLEVFLRAAEAGLVLLLFTDASRTDLRVLRNILTLPARLLSTGILLTILLGALFALIVFLASIVLGAVYLAHAGHEPGDPTIRLAVIATVLLSIFAHGLSALPGINLYAAKIGALGPDAPEHQGVGGKPAGLHT
jgi:hypothetical protein